MTTVELLTSAGTVLGAAAASYGVHRFKKPKDQSDRIARLETDLVRLRARAEANKDNVERLIDRCERIEEDMRQSAADAAERHKDTFEILGEMRGTLRALLRDGDA